MDRILAAFEITVAAADQQISLDDVRDEEDFDLEPTVVNVARPTSPRYSSITDVPNDQNPNKKSLIRRGCEQGFQGVTNRA